MRVFPALTACLLMLGCSYVPVAIESYTVEFIKSEEVSKYIESRRVEAAVGDSPDGFLLVRITTEEDLLNMTLKKSYIIHPKVEFCDRGEEAYRLNISGMSVNGKSLLERKYEYLKFDRSQILELGRTYDVLIYTALDEIIYPNENRTEVDRPGHNLRRDPDDICITIVGGHTGARVKSSTIRIDKGKIIEMLQ